MTRILPTALAIAVVLVRSGCIRLYKSIVPIARDRRCQITALAQIGTEPALHFDEERVEYVAKLLAEVVVEPSVQKGIVARGRHGEHVEQYEQTARVLPIEHVLAEVFQLYIKESLFWLIFTTNKQKTLTKL